MPWLDGLVALVRGGPGLRPARLDDLGNAAVVTGPMPVRSSAPAALSCLSAGKVIAGVGPGSSAVDYSLTHQPFNERWSRFEAAAVRLRELLAAGKPTDPKDPVPPPAGRCGGPFDHSDLAG